MSFVNVTEILHQKAGISFTCADWRAPALTVTTVPRSSNLPMKSAFIQAPVGTLSHAKSLY